MFKMRCLFVAALVAIFPVHSWAQAPGGSPSTSATVFSGALSTTQRAEITAELIAKFRDKVRNSPNGNVQAWSAKLGKAVSGADARNVLRATTARTLEGMHAALNGAMSEMVTPRRSGIVPQTIGSTTADTSYTPLPNGRCRVADSRVITSPLVSGVKRSIDVEDIGSYAAQGGAGTVANGDGSANCGIPSFATAIVVNVFAFNPTGNALVRVFSNDEAAAEGASFLASSGRNTSSNLIVRSCQTCIDEIAIQANASLDYVIDVVGYFIPPQATALDCVTTAETTLNLNPGATGNVVAPACSAGFTETSTNCAANDWFTPFVFFKNGTCSARSNGGAATNIRASRTCCRVPGR